jgi:hypothetical protein
MRHFEPTDVFSLQTETEFYTTIVLTIIVVGYVIFNLIQNNE